MDRTDDDRTVKVIKWAWRYHALDATFFDSIEDAVLAAEHAADAGEEALDCIEVIESGVSRVLTDDEYHAIVDLIEASERHATETAPKAIVVLRLASPNGKDWTTYQGFADIQAAEKEANRYRQMLGAQRVRVDPVTVPFSLTP